MIKNIYVTLAAMFVMICYSCTALGADESSAKSPALQGERYLDEELPSIVVAYSLYCARYTSFKLLEADPQNVLVMLKKKIDALPGGISTGLGFAHMAFIVQNNISDHLSGFIRLNNRPIDQSKFPFESILFVTTPVESFGNRVLVVLSSVSPERTTIFSVDNRINIELLYDSFNKNLFDQKKTTIGSIYAVRVTKPGRYLLEERMDPGGRAFFSTYENRSFVMDVTKGTFEISLEVRSPR